LLLAIDNPGPAAGNVFNVGDEEVLTVRQVIELTAGALGRALEIVSMPFELAVPARPLLTQPSATHRVLDLTHVRTVLGYRDVVPARDAIAATARWLADHPCEPAGQEEMVLTDPFDYRAEDELIDAWHRALSSVVQPEFATRPGYGLASSGPGGRPRTNPEFLA
jgi:hypothetical protein